MSDKYSSLRGRSLDTVADSMDDQEQAEASRKIKHRIRRSLKKREVRPQPAIPFSRVPNVKIKKP